jgi:serine/threonine-protein kinase RsbT
VNDDGADDLAVIDEEDFVGHDSSPTYSAEFAFVHDVGQNRRWMQAPSDTSRGRDVIEININVEGDIVTARGAGRDMCRDLGLSEINQVKVATAISELARNIYHYAKTGRIVIKKLGAPRPGVEIVASDKGPGIADLKLVLSGNYRSRTGMGKGLLGARRLVDQFEIDTAPDRGTTVTLRKFVR